MSKFTVNGKAQTFTGDPETPLLWYLRDVAGMTGTKFGCGRALCGACTVHVDGTAVRSCQVQVGDINGQAVVTIEGLSPDRSHPAQKAWIAHQVPQCGFCQSGMLMSVAGAMKAGHHGSEIASEVKNLCVCGTYQRIKQAVSTL